MKKKTFRSVKKTLKPKYDISSTRGQDIANILEANKDKGFIQRILNKDKCPVLPNKDGSSSTHSMAWSEVDGKFIVYPTVLYGKKGKLKRFDARDALPLVMESGNFIEFDTPDQADWFSKEYKSYWQK